MQRDYEAFFVMVYFIPGRISRSILNAFLGVLFILFLSAGVTSAEPFDQDSKSKLEAEVTHVRDTALYWAHNYETWDLIFKALLLVLGILSAVGAALAGYWKNSTPPWLTVGNIVVGAAITALTAFAFTQINFPARAQTYERKYSALQGLLSDLQYSNPDRNKFIAALSIVYTWNDSTAPAPGDAQAVLLQAQGVPSK
jgi:hypothetical protein